MSKVIVAVGSTRRPKLAAAEEALAQAGPLLAPGAEFEIVGVEVGSGVNHTPLSRAELMAGARQRAEALLRLAKDRRENWSYFVGLEGGLEVVEEQAKRHVFLVNWAYVLDASGRGAFGHSGGILMPRELASRVVDEGVELAEAVDAFAGGRGIRNKQGAWGVLSRDLIPRQDAFRLAIVNAFAPFYSAGLYEDVSRGSAARAGEI